MTASLNLTPARGPSVWERPEAIAEPWQAATLVGGAILAGCAWPFRSRTSRLLGGAGLLTMAVALTGKWDTVAVESLRQWLKAMRDGDDEVDRTIDASFPASDPASR
jgi:hypothetical protein